MSRPRGGVGIHYTTLRLGVLTCCLCGMNDTIELSLSPTERILALHGRPDPLEGGWTCDACVNAAANEVAEEVRGG